MLFYHIRALLPTQLLIPLVIARIWPTTYFYLPYQTQEWEGGTGEF
jgi:hypothetical protein